MQHINLKENKLIITFKFDRRFVDAIKTIDGRVWNKEMKRWEIPKENVKQTLDVLVPLGFNAHLDVVMLSKKEDQFLQNINRIRKSDDGGYTGSLPLFDFQKKGAMFLKEMPGVLLGDVPGLGKTIQTIAATDHEEQILIFCPASLKYSWAEEIKKWVKDAKVLVVDGNKKKRIEQWMHALNGYYIGSQRVIPKFVIANYELLLHDYAYIDRRIWPVIVCDEATRISNPDARTTKLLKLLKCKKKIALTGTPVSNTPDDIYSLIDWIAPGYLGTFSQFRKKYCIFDYDPELAFGTRVTGYRNMNELSEKIGRFMLRRTKEEVFDDFPKKTTEDIKFEMSPEEKKLYENIKELIWHELHSLKINKMTIGIMPVKMLRLKQCTNHPELLQDEKNTPSTKLQVLKDLLSPILASGEKVIIFTQFSEMAKILYRELEGYPKYLIYGEVLSQDRMEIVNEFNAEQKGSIMIMTEAGAYGLNLQTASYVIHYDLPWSVAKYTQRSDRAHRIGQKKAVTIYNLIAKNTIDQYVNDVLMKKYKVSNDVLADSTRMEEAGLTLEDIEEILNI